MQEHKTTKLVQASTIACSSSAMLEQHGSTRSSRLADVAWRAKWNFGLLSHFIWKCLYTISKTGLRSLPIN